MAKILVVDDSMVARMSLKSCIPKDQEHQIFEAADGASALAMFKNVQPDITFLDITMPDKNGLDVLEELRVEYPKALVIILSADIQKQTQERAAALGAYSIIKKPPARQVVQEELLKALALAGVANG